MLNLKILPDDNTTTYQEMHLVDYPIGLINERVPKDKTGNEIKTIEWEQFITLPNGERKTQRWTVTGSDKHGLARGEDLPMFFLLVQLWCQQGFNDDRVVQIGRLYRLLKLLGLPTTKQYYDRTRDGLNRLIGTTIYTNYCIYDPRRGRLLPTFKFNLLDQVSFDWDDMEIDEAVGVCEPKGYVKFTEGVLDLIKAGYLKPTDAEMYWSLPDVKTKRVWEILDKGRVKGKTQELPAFSFAKRVGTTDKTLKSYSPKDVMKIYSPSLDVLVDDKGYLERYAWPKRGKKTFLAITYAGDENEWVDLTNEEQRLVTLIADTFDDQGSKRYYARLISELGIDTVRELFSRVRTSWENGKVKKPGAVMAKSAEDLRKKRGVNREREQAIRACRLCNTQGYVLIQKTDSAQAGMVECRHDKRELELAAMRNGWTIVQR